MCLPSLSASPRECPSDPSLAQARARCRPLAAAPARFLPARGRLAGTETPELPGHGRDWQQGGTASSAQILGLRDHHANSSPFARYCQALSSLPAPCNSRNMKITGKECNSSTC